MACFVGMFSVCGHRSRLSLLFPRAVRSWLPSVAGARVAYFCAIFPVAVLGIALFIFAGALYTSHSLAPDVSDAALQMRLPSPLRYLHPGIF